MKNLQCCLVLLFVKVTFAQSFLLYNYHTNLLNPAFVGAGKSLGVRLGYLRYDFQGGMQDAPATTTFSVTSPLAKNLGLGVSVMNQNIFVKRNTEFYADVSYKLQIRREKYLYFGIKTGFANNVSDFKSLKINDPLFNQNQSKTHFRLGAGVYFKMPNFFAHIATPNFLLGTLEPAVKDGNKVISENLQEKFQTYLGTGYHFRFTKYFVVSPVFFANITVAGQNEYNYAAVFSYDTMIDLAFNYKSSGGITGALSFYTKKWRLGYAYEALSSDFMAKHDFLLIYNF